MHQRNQFCLAWVSRHMLVTHQLLLQTVLEMTNCVTSFCLIAQVLECVQCWEKASHQMCWFFPRILQQSGADVLDSLAVRRYKYKYMYVSRAVLCRAPHTTCPRIYQIAALQKTWRLAA